MLVRAKKGEFMGSAYLGKPYNNSVIMGIDLKSFFTDCPLVLVKSDLPDAKPIKEIKTGEVVIFYGKLNTRVRWEDFDEGSD